MEKKIIDCRKIRRRDIFKNIKERNKSATRGSRWYLFRLVGTLIVFIVFGILQKCQQHKNAIQNRADCYKELNREVRGTVSYAFYDENPDHKGFVIGFTNGEKYTPYSLANWGALKLQEGDSVYKKPGTFITLIYKKGDRQPVIIADTINCDAAN